MNTTRIFASFCLALSCCALITASSVSVGDQPGVIRMTSHDEIFDPPAPLPSAGKDPVAGNQNAPAQNPVPDNNVPPVDNGGSVADNAPTTQNGPGVELYAANRLHSLLHPKWRGHRISGPWSSRRGGQPVIRALSSCLNPTSATVWDLTNRISD